MLTAFIRIQLTVTTWYAYWYDSNQAAQRADVRPRRRDQRGSVTMEHVIWAVAVIAIVGGVVVAITNYVDGQSAKIK